MKKLSAYTHARWCSDTADIMYGIDEITDAIKHRNRAGKKVPFYFYVRLSKLKNKLSKLIDKKNSIMNYRCKELKRMIERYESTADAKALINSLKNHIDEYGGIYDVAGISKDDFAELGYDTSKIDDTLTECIANQIDIGDRWIFSLECLAEKYGIPKIDEEID